MKIYKLLFAALILSIVLAVPLSAATHTIRNNLQIERDTSDQLRTDIQTRDQQLEEERQKLQQKTDEAEKLKQEKQKLESDLQAKNEQKARTAAALAAVSINGNCEQYRPLVEKYFGSATDAAMITMAHESGCDPNQISPTNDHGLFQLNGIPIYDPEANIAYAYNHKFVTARRGANNFSAWYAVCTPDQVPKYQGIWCA